MKKIKLNFTQSFIPFILIFAFPSCSTDNKDVSSESTLKKVTLSKNEDEIKKTFENSGRKIVK
jgi:hypothetical protein